jgi:ribosome-binding factor A
MRKHPTRPQRGQRVADQIQRDLAEIIQREVPTDRAGLVTLTEVEVSPDYAHATVYFTCIGATPAAAAGVLNGKSGYFHALLFKRLSIHTIPSLQFVYDDSVERGFAIDRLIDEANRPLEAGRRKPKE